MHKKLMVVGVMLFYLTACDNDSVKESKQTNPQESVSQSTAIYLPGGVGVDFGLLPENDRAVTDKSGEGRVVTYVLSESYKTVDEALSSILISAGYKRSQADVGDKVRVIYRKKNVSPVLVRYSEQVSEGFNRKTRVTISWTIKK